MLARHVSTSAHPHISPFAAVNAGAGSLAFISLNDGSSFDCVQVRPPARSPVRCCRRLTLPSRTAALARGGHTRLLLRPTTALPPLQIVAEASKTAGFPAIATSGGTGASFRVTGTVVRSPAKGQAIEVTAAEVEVLGTADASTYPLAKKKHSLEFLRVSRAGRGARCVCVCVCVFDRGACTPAWMNALSAYDARCSSRR